MAATAIRKTTAMLYVERLHRGREIEEIVRETCARHPRNERAAVELGISVNTLRTWKKLFRVSDPA